MSTLIEIDSVRMLSYPGDGPVLGSAASAADVIGDAFGCDADLVRIPAARLDPAFFTLRNGMAGEFAQKFANYRICLAIIGDIGAYTAASDALADFVRESNRGRALWFLGSDDDLRTRLGTAR